MKVFTIVVVAILAGIGIGFAATVAEFGAAPPEPKLLPDSKRAGTTGDLVIGESSYDAGIMMQYQKGEHTFVLHNKGRGAVDLKPGDPSCKCTGVFISHLESFVPFKGVKHILPGETSKVKLQWDTGRSRGEFNHGVPIVITNSPVSWVRLSITGEVFPDYRFTPGVVWVRTLSPHEKSTHQVKLFFYRDNDVQIVREQFSNEAIAGLFDVRCEPLSPDEVMHEKAAKCGYLVTTSIKDGLPIGPLRQNITLTTSRETNPPVVLAITGDVREDVSVIGIGPTWNETSQTLSLGEIKQAEGNTSDLMVQINGKHQFSTELRIVEVVPQQLQVTLGERKTLSNKVTDSIPMKVEIPPGTAVCNHLGGDGQEAGRIVIETTHPLYPEVVIHVKFAVVE